MPNITKPSGLSKIWAEGGTKVDPGDSKVNIGWVVQLPPYQYQNWVDNRQDRAIAHINQHGVPEWDNLTEYQGLLSYTQGANGILYKCIQTNIGKDPTNPLNGDYWSTAFEEYGSVAAVQTQLNAHIANYQTLSNISNVTAARNNLSVYSKAEADTRFASVSGSTSQVFAVALATQPEQAPRLSQVLERSANLGDVPSPAQARTNLGITSTATFPESYFLRSAQNLSDLQSASAARSNLGLTTTATTNISAFLLKSDNLAGLANVATARTNLGLGTASVLNLNQVLQSGNNLSDLTNTQDARNNLGLGGAAVKNVFGVPGDFDFTSLQAPNGYAKLGGSGLIIQWGRVVLGTGPANITFPVPFTTAVFHISGTPIGNTYGNPSSAAISEGSRTGATAWPWGAGNFTLRWIAIGV